MVEVKIKELSYIQDIPVDMLQDAIDAGEVRKGRTVGLMVRPVGVVSDGDVLIELKLTEDGQEELVKVGAIIPVESSGNVCVLRPEWSMYIEQLKEEEKMQLENFTVVVREDSHIAAGVVPGAVSD
ncbi:MAG: hypothetical protein NTU61_05450 [Candidatus Altiarchaeota archaeon]|nr:hypothetical protein [Candidatus Altiarchaeota archaeon]